MTDTTQEAGGDATGPLTFDQALERLSGAIEQSPATQLDGDDDEAQNTATPEPDDEAEDEEVGDADDTSSEAEEADEEADSEDDDADDAEGQSGDVVPDTARVRLDDGTEVSIGELKRGSLLMRDYTQKTQEVAQERQTVRQMQDQLHGYSQSILQQLHMANALAQYAAPRPPDERLRDEDPVQYMMLRQDYEAAAADFNQRLAQIQQGIAETQNVRGQAEQAMTEEQLQQARQRLREVVPELNDPQRYNAIVNDIVSTANALGFSADEVKSWRDPRFGHAMYLASQAYKLNKAKPKAVSKTQGKPPVQRAGKQQSGKDQKRGTYVKSMKRLRQTGSTQDAIEALISGGFVSGE